MEAELLNKIADLQFQNQQLTELVDQCFAALATVSDHNSKMSERTMKWLEQFRQFRQKEEGK